MYLNLLCSVSSAATHIGVHDAGQQKVIMALTQKQTGKYLNWDGKAPKEHPSSHAFVTASAAPQAGKKLARPLRRPVTARGRRPHWSANLAGPDALHSLL